jgi:hypothetical protein
MLDPDVVPMMTIDPRAGSRVHLEESDRYE